MKTLESLLGMKIKTKNGIKFTPDFRVTVQGEVPQGVKVMVHPFGHKGDVANFIVKGNELKPYRGEL